MGIVSLFKLKPCFHFLALVSLDYKDCFLYVFFRKRTGSYLRNCIGRIPVNCTLIYLISFFFLSHLTETRLYFYHR